MCGWNIKHPEGFHQWVSRQDTGKLCSVLWYHFFMLLLMLIHLYWLELAKRQIGDLFNLYMSDVCHLFNVMSVCSQPGYCFVEDYFVRISLTIVPCRKVKKRPSTGSCVCFCFVFIDITFHVSTAQNGLYSCCCSALFRATCFCTFLSLPCSVNSLADCHCVSHFLLLLVPIVRSPWGLCKVRVKIRV